MNKTWTLDGVMDTRYSEFGPRVDGSKIVVFPTRACAIKAANLIGANRSGIKRIQTRFQVGWGLYDGIGGGYLSKQRYQALVAANEQVPT